MAHAQFLREKARQLRVSRRLTIDELAARLSLPRTTIYYWVRDLPLPRSGASGGFPNAAQRKGTRAMQAKYRLLREAAYEDGRRTFAQLAKEATFRDFVCLYMAEGSKRSRNVVAICNSDPAIIRIGDRWIKRFARNPVRYSIQYHADQDLGVVAAFWAGEVGCEPQAIRFQRKSNSNGLSGRTWRSANGVLTVWTGDTQFRARLEAWMDCIRETWV